MIKTRTFAVIVTQDTKTQPFQDISVVICQVTSANKLWDLNGFSHSWAEKKILCLLHIITRWHHQRVYSQTKLED